MFQPDVFSIRSLNLASRQAVKRFTAYVVVFIAGADGRAMTNFKSLCLLCRHETMT